MLEQMEKYVQSVLPDGMPQRKREPLHDELLCHLLDRYEFYREIGFDDEESTQKAIHDMGEDEKTTDYIRNEFDELYFEKAWWAVLVFFGVLVLNAIAGVLGVWVVAGDSLGPPSVWRTAVSFLMIAILLFGNWAANHFGCKKTLLSMGIAEFLIAASWLFCFFPQPAFYSIFAGVFYLLDRFTPLVLIDYGTNFLETFCAFIGVFFVFLLSAVSFILSGRIHRRGPPSEEIRLSTQIGAVAFLFLAVLSVYLLRPSVEYFRDYPVWFDETSDSIDQDTAVLYDELCNMQNFNEAKAYLKTYGYVSTKDYMDTLPANDVKKFEKNLNQIDFFFDDDEYEIFFNPQKTKMGDDYNYRSNAFLYLQAGDDGKLTGIGVGNGMELYGKYGETVIAKEANDTKACMEAFKTLQAGDSKQTVLETNGKKFGEMYTEFCEFTNQGTKEYYRFVCDTQSNDMFDEKQVPLYLEFYFENGVLIDGNIYYRTYTESGSEKHKIELQK